MSNKLLEELHISTMSDEDKSDAMISYMKNNPGWSMNDGDKNNLRKLGYEPSENMSPDINFSISFAFTIALLIGTLIHYFDNIPGFTSMAIIQIPLASLLPGLPIGLFVSWVFSFIKK